ncbi:MAG: MFS transporter [Akkermansiaceae bacterium]|jgi:acyl-[acyl-carrier-protein]-phospholipid O-acyltransferase/long-chain-fatty-acid--[acyl-carrier-protein] ligase
METDSPESEPTKRKWLGYWSMIVQQTQNAFNDKAAQFILIPLGGAVGYAVESWAGLMISLPFVLFAPLAGWMSDRFSKRNVLIGSAIAQIVILALIATAICFKNMPTALIGFFLLATQAAFFSPAKFGINKELVGSRHLGFASGVQQMMAMLALLVGQIIAGWWYDERYQELGSKPMNAWDAAFFPLFMLTCLSVPAVGMALLIPKLSAHAKTPISVKLLFSHFRDLGELWKERGLRRASFGVAFFWGFAAFVNLWSVKIAKAMTDGGEGFGTLSSIFMAAASLGMAIGFGFASWLLRKKIDLGWVPLGGLLMTISALALAWFPMGKAEAYLDLLDIGFLKFISNHSHEAIFLVTLCVLAFSSAIFLAPMNAWMQDRYPADKRGELQAAVNLQDCFAGIVAVVAIEVMFLVSNSLGMSELAGFRMQLIVIGSACGIMTVYVLRILPADFIRLFVGSLVKTIYRIKYSGLENIPKSGGALLLPNHVTFADAFFLSVVSDRPLRFVMDETFMVNPTIRLSARLFGTVPIRRSHPLEAIRTTVEALANGHLVVLFPEGQLTRTGALCELERGFELIAKGAQVPVLPVWVDGSWGSIFSFERGRYFKKMPYGIPYGLSVAVGEPITAPKINRQTLQAALLKTSAQAIAQKFPDNTNPQGRNVHQLMQFDALPRRSTIHILEYDPDMDSFRQVLENFVKASGGKLNRERNFFADEGVLWIGAAELRKQIDSARAISTKCLFYDFSKQAIDLLEIENMVHLPCLALEGQVISMSMPHPQLPKSDSFFQAGHKPKSYGKILPGWYVENGKLMPSGAAWPENLEIDSESFVVCK